MHKKTKADGSISWPSSPENYDAPSPPTSPKNFCFHLPTDFSRALFVNAPCHHCTAYTPVTAPPLKTSYETPAYALPQKCPVFRQMLRKKQTPECACDSRFLDDLMEPNLLIACTSAGVVSPLLRLLSWRTTKLSGPLTTSRLLRTRRPHPETLANILRNPRRTATPRINKTMPTPTTPREARPPNPPPCDGRRVSLRPRPNPALQAHERSSTRHAKGIFTMDEIREPIILDQHLASAFNDLYNCTDFCTGLCTC